MNDSVAQEVVVNSSGSCQMAQKPILYVLTIYMIMHRKYNV